MGSGLKTVTGRFVFDPNDGIYQDHFPGNPVVPGSVIVYAFSRALQELGAAPVHVCLSNFRFKKFIGPGEYSYDISTEPDRYRCTLSDETGIVATGDVVL